MTPNWNVKEMVKSVVTSGTKQKSCSKISFTEQNNWVKKWSENK